MIDKQVGLLPMGVHLSACAMFLWPHFPLKGLCIPPSPRFNWARWLRSVDEWRQVRCSASTLDMDVLMVGSHFAVPADREDGCLPAVPQHFVQNAHSADGSGCLRWGRDQHQWVPCWWPRGLEWSPSVSQVTLLVSFTFKMEFSGQWSDSSQGLWMVFIFPL